MDNLPADPKSLTDRGTRGVMSTAGGLGLLGVNWLLGVPVVGTVISVGLLGLGAIGLFGKTKTDKTSGTVLAAAGIAGLTTLFVPGLAHSLLSLGGIGLLGYGVYNLISFAKGLSRKK